jgi:hypothetical protein
MAALTPTRSHGSASGTATVRLIRAKNELCWTIVTSGLPVRTRAAIIDTDSHRILVDRPMRHGRSDGCARYTWTNGENLATPFKRGRVHLSLNVTSLDGRRLLGGRILSDLGDPNGSPA